jgi:hypothetical protein
LVTVVSPRTVAAEAGWDGLHGGGGGWRGVVVTSLYDGWYGYPIRLTKIYRYASNYSYDYRIRTPIAMFTASSTSPFAMFGVCETIGL